MPRPNVAAALRAAASRIPPSRRKDRTACPTCGRPLGEGGGLEEGGGGLVGDGWLGGEEDTPSGHSSRELKTEDRVRVFLAALREYPLVNRAARICGVNPRTVYGWRERDAEFRARWAEALDEGVERLELRAHRDALEGTDREATLQRIFVLKRHRPEYRDNVTVHHQGGGQDARDAALLRRAMVEALGPYPEARAALAATLSRLAAGAVARGEDAGEVERSRSELEHQGGDRAAGEGGTAGGDLAAGSSRGGTGDGGGDRSLRAAGTRAHAGAGGGGRQAGGGGPVLSASTSTPALLKGRINDDDVVDAEVVGDADDSGDSC